MAEATQKSQARNRSLAALHTGKRKLGWDDITYRDYLASVTGKRSASELTDLELARVLDSMRARGFKRADGTTGPQIPPTQLDKARELWTVLHGLGELRQPTEQGFCSYVERMTQRSRPEWCTPEQLSKVIEGLKAWIARAQKAVVGNKVDVE
jgi:phage gp16-like protein